MVPKIFTRRGFLPLQDAPRHTFPGCSHRAALNLSLHHGHVGYSPAVRPMQRLGLCSPRQEAARSRGCAARTCLELASPWEGAACDRQRQQILCVLAHTCSVQSHHLGSTSVSSLSAYVTR